MRRTILALALSTLAWGQSGASGSEDKNEDKRIVREKGYHYAHPKNTGPTPESTKENSSDKDAKQRQIDRHGNGVGKAGKKIEKK